MSDACCSFIKNQNFTNPPIFEKGRLALIVIGQVSLFLQRKFILLSDSQNDGSFLVHHFLAMYIKGMSIFHIFFLKQEAEDFNFT